MKLYKTITRQGAEVVAIELCQLEVPESLMEAALAHRSWADNYEIQYGQNQTWTPEKWTGFVEILRGILIASGTQLKPDQETYSVYTTKNPVGVGYAGQFTNGRYIWVGEIGLDEFIVEADMGTGAPSRYFAGFKCIIDHLPELVNTGKERATADAEAANASAKAEAVRRAEVAAKALAAVKEKKARAKAAPVAEMWVG